MSSPALLIRIACRASTYFQDCCSDLFNVSDGPANTKPLIYYESFKRMMRRSDRRRQERGGSARHPAALGKVDEDYKHRVPDKA